METSLMSESVVDAADVEETVTQEHVEIQLGYDQGSLSTIFSVTHCVMCRRVRPDFLIFLAPQARFFFIFSAPQARFFVSYQP